MITDLTPYRHYVDQFNLTEEEKLAWANAVLMIVESMFDMHLGTAHLPLKDRDVDAEPADGRMKEEAP
jgi:hypothetical protein